MIARLGRRPFAWGWLFCAATALATEPSADDLRRLVGDLDASSFTAREQAAQSLIASGDRAIGPLSEAVRSGSPESSWRAAAVLIQIAINGDDDVFAQSAASLTAATATNDTARGINLDELRAKQTQKRRAVAEASIRAHGGLFGLHVDNPLALTLETASPPDPQSLTERLDSALGQFAAVQPEPPSSVEPPPAPAPPPELPAEELRALTQGELPQSEPAAGILIADAFVSPELQEAEVPEEVERALTLNATWRGGDDGLADLGHLPDIVSVRLEQAPVSDAALKYISFLPRLRDMRILRNPFSPAALGLFRQRHPNVTIFVSDRR